MPEILTQGRGGGKVLRASFAALVAVAALLSNSACGNSKGGAPESGKAESHSATNAGATASGAKTPGGDACSLISRADVEAAVGKLREAPAPIVALAGEPTCSYLNANGAGVTVRVHDADYYDVQKNLNSGPQAVSLQGLGEEAYYVKKSSAVDLWARKGDAGLYLNGTVGLDAMKRMAAKILERL